MSLLYEADVLASFEKGESHAGFLLAVKTHDFHR